jgi:Subtilase family
VNGPVLSAILCACTLSFTGCGSASLPAASSGASLPEVQASAPTRLLNTLIPCIGRDSTPEALVAGTPLRVVDYFGEAGTLPTGLGSSRRDVPWCLLTLDPTSLSTDDAITRINATVKARLYTLPYAISPETNGYGFDPGVPAFDPRCDQLAELGREAATAQAIQASGLRELLGVRDPALTGRGTTIAVLDGGIGATPSPNALSRNFLRGANPNDTRDDFDCVETPYFDGHGSVVTQIIRSVAPETNILSLKVCDANGRCPASSIIKALLYIRNRYAGFPTVDVINMSFGGRQTQGDAVLKTILQDMMNVAFETLFVISAGNNPNDAAHYPADFQGMHFSLVPVAAAKRSPDWALASFNTQATITNSPYAPLTAPATRLEITVDGVLRTVTGTSFAAPSVSALAVLERQRNPALQRIASHLHWYMQTNAFTVNGFKLARLGP